MATNLDRFPSSSQSTDSPQTPDNPKVPTGAKPSFLPDVTPVLDVTQAAPNTVAAAPVPDDAVPATAHMPQPADLTDEEQALRSLDDTIMRPTPLRTSVWADELRRPPREESPRQSRVPTMALVCVVAVVSFVAGGVTARLSSQVPVLFAQRQQSTETQAHYVEEPLAPQAQSEPDEQVSTPDEQPVAPVQQEERTPTPPSYDTGYDTTDDSPSRQPTEERDDVWQWTLDDEGANSLSYDSTSGEVTVDYEGYSLTVPIGELIGNDDELRSLTAPRDTSTELERRYRYDDGTGYDTEEDRDWYVRRSPQGTLGWS